MAEVEERVVELAGEGERPEGLPFRLDAGRIGRWMPLRTEEEEVGGPGGAVDCDLEMAIPPRVRPGLALEVRPGDAPLGGTARRERPGALPDHLFEARPRGELVDEAPIEGAPAPHPFLHRAEEIGVIAPDLALVDDPG